MRNRYSIQKIKSVRYSTPLNTGNSALSCSNVCKNVTRIFDRIVIVIKMSNPLLIRLLLSPIWMILNIFFFKIRLCNQQNTLLRCLVPFTQKARYHFRMISGFSLFIHLLSVFRLHNNNPTIYKTDLHFIIHKLVAHR